MNSHTFGRSHLCTSSHCSSVMVLYMSHLKSSIRSVKLLGVIQYPFSENSPFVLFESQLGNPNTFADQNGFCVKSGKLYKVSSPNRLFHLPASLCLTYFYYLIRPSRVNRPIGNLYLADVSAKRFVNYKSGEWILTSSFGSLTLFDR